MNPLGRHRSQGVKGEKSDPPFLVYSSKYHCEKCPRHLSEKKTTNVESIVNAPLRDRNLLLKSNSNIMNAHRLAVRVTFVVAKPGPGRTVVPKNYGIVPRWKYVQETCHCSPQNSRVIHIYLQNKVYCECERQLASSLCSYFKV